MNVVTMTLIKLGGGTFWTGVIKVCIHEEEASKLQLEYICLIVSKNGISGTERSHNRNIAEEKYFEILTKICLL